MRLFVLIANILLAAAEAKTFTVCKSPNSIKLNENTRIEKCIEPKNIEVNEMIFGVDDVIRLKEEFQRKSNLI